MTSHPRFRPWFALTVALALVATSAASGQGIPRGRTPLRTARNEISALRADYAEAFNRRAPAEVASLFTPDATLIRTDGTMLSGREAIRRAFAAEAPSWSQLTLASDTVRIVGRTAWDVGTSRASRSEGGEEAGHYLAVLRRSMKSWRISSLAIVPENRTMAGADAATAADSVVHP